MSLTFKKIFFIQVLLVNYLPDDLRNHVAIVTLDIS